MQKLNRKIEDLKSLMVSQRNNAKHYFWNENDDATGHYWQDAAAETKKDIEQLEREKAIIQKWKAAEIDDVSPSQISNLRSDIQDLGDEIHGDIHHGECFHDKQMLEDFVASLNKLEVKTLQYWASNQETAKS